MNWVSETRLFKRPEASGRRELAREQTDHRPTSTRHRRVRPHVDQVRAAGSRHRLDRGRRKDDVSNPEQGRRRHGAATAAGRGEEGSRDKDAVNHRRRYAKDVRPITPSVTLRRKTRVRQLRQTASVATLIHHYRLSTWLLSFTGLSYTSSR